jgi:hypothetical protein
MKGFRTHWVLAGLLCAGSMAASGQEFRVFDRNVQVHGFGTQGYVKTDQNNWLTMNTANGGSGEFTDFGANATVPLFDKFRVGAQIYEHNVGQLGKWHPQLDWASGDYKFKSWLGFRAGKVKTVMGLYNDTQDMDSLHTFALLPQGIYPIDMRDATLAHLGGDLYGTIKPVKKLGSFEYTTYGGDRRDSIYGGYPYNLQIHGISTQKYGGPVVGGDLRWNTPLKGLTVGSSYVYEMITGSGLLNPSIALGGPNIETPYKEWSNNDFMNQYYGTWSSRSGKLRLDSEYRRYWRDQEIFSGAFRVTTDVRPWYVAASYQITPRLAVGGYYSRFTIGGSIDVPGQSFAASVSDPSRHLDDKVVAARFDLTKYWYAKVEGHFVNGYGGFYYPDGFYPAVNPNGVQATTNGVVLRTGMYF